MCGILGAFRPTIEHRQRFEEALATIQHRGPDGCGIDERPEVVLGHLRLAIIDLRACGAQPMVDASTQAVLTYNGEIYNYLEIRDELRALGAVFETESDTEVLLRAYLQWDTGMFSRLNGMWAFAIWDPRQRRLLLARDRFGVKPLYYAQPGGSLLFGSEPKALMALEPSLAVPDTTAIYELFSTSRSHAGARSFFKAINALPAGCYASISLDEAQAVTTRYWDYPEADPDPSTGKDDAEAFAHLFDSAVKLRMRSDVPVGITLSGGLDSSAVLASSRKTSAASLRCFTSVYSRELRGEEAWAIKAAALGNANLTSVEAEISDWSDTLRQIVWHMDSPGYSPAVFPMWQIMRRARAENIPVLLEGQGADELLGGYPQYMTSAVTGSVSDWLGGRGSAGAAIDQVRGSVRTFGVKWSSLWLLRRLFPWGYERWSEQRGGLSFFEQDFVKNVADRDEGRSVTGRGGLFEQLRNDHSRDILPALLHYGDAISMAHGIESRLPFMDYRLVEWVFRRQPDVISRGETKWPVRSYLRQEGFNVIAERPDKQGYPTPLAHWLRREGETLLRDLLATPNAQTWSIFAREVAAVQLDRALKGNYAALYHLYKMWTVNIWLEQVKTQARGEHPRFFKSPPLLQARGQG